MWATVYGLGGYVLEDNVHRLTGPVGLVAVTLAAMLIVGALMYLRRNPHRLEDEAERAMPGPLATSQPGGAGV